MQKVLGVLAGKDLPLEVTEAWARSADVLIAADGGANILLKLGLPPAVAIGDFDSIEREAKSAAKTIVFDPDQDRSDCDKLLHLATAQGHEEITICNVEGDRLDHVLGTFQSAARASIRVRFVLRSGFGYILRGGENLQVDCHIGDPVSLLPLEDCASAFLAGTEWKLSGDDLAARGLTSLSNRASATTIVASLQSGSAVLFISGNTSATPVWK